MSERELLAVLLGDGGPADAFESAGAILDRWGGLGAIATAYPEELSALPGLGPAKAACVVAAFELGRRAKRPIDGVVLRGPADVARVARPHLVGQPRERVVVLVCNARNQVRRVVTVSQGGIDQAPLPVREILNTILRQDGRAFALAHHHPSGDPTPSAADQRGTREVREAARLTGLRFLSHVVLACNLWREIT